MFRKTILAVLAASLVAWLIAGAETLPSMEPGPIGIEVVVSPEQGDTGVYRCNMELTDLSTGNILAAPSVRLAAGTEAKFYLGIPFGGMAFEATVEVNEAGDKALYAAKLKRGSDLLLSQAFAVHLVAVEASDSN